MLDTVIKLIEFPSVSMRFILKLRGFIEEGKSETVIAVFRSHFYFTPMK